MTPAPFSLPLRARRPLSLAAATVSVALALWPDPALADPSDALLTPWTAFHQRSAANALQARCGLLNADTGRALAAAERHARALLLRHGASDQAVRAARADAAAAIADAACDGDDAAALAAHIEMAFQAWSHTPQARFPGFQRFWDARRRWSPPAVIANADTVARQDTRARPPMRWLVRQDAPEPITTPRVETASKASLGLTLIDEEIRLSALLVGPAARAHSARMTLRDSRRASRATVERLRRFAPARRDGLAVKAAPDALSRVFWASQRLADPHVQLLDHHTTDEANSAPRAALFAFNATALTAFADLDPPEVVIVELELATGDQPAQSIAIAFEVGDFAAARDFALQPPLDP